MNVGSGGGGAHKPATELGREISDLPAHCRPSAPPYMGNICALNYSSRRSEDREAGNGAMGALTWI